MAQHSGVTGSDPGISLFFRMGRNGNRSAAAEVADQLGSLAPPVPALYFGSSEGGAVRERPDLPEGVGTSFRAGIDFLSPGPCDRIQHPVQKRNPDSGPS